MRNAGRQVWREDSWIALFCWIFFFFLLTLLPFSPSFYLQQFFIPFSLPHFLPVLLALLHFYLFLLTTLWFSSPSVSSPFSSRSPLLLFPSSPLSACVGYHSSFPPPSPPYLLVPISPPSPLTYDSLFSSILFPLLLFSTYDTKFGSF